MRVRSLLEWPPSFVLSLLALLWAQDPKTLQAVLGFRLQLTLLLRFPRPFFFSTLAFPSSSSFPISSCLFVLYIEMCFSWEVCFEYLHPSSWILYHPCSWPWMWFVSGAFHHYWLCFDALRSWGYMFTLPATYTVVRPVHQVVVIYPHSNYTFWIGHGEGKLRRSVRFSLGILEQQLI